MKRMMAGVLALLLLFATAAAETVTVSVWAEDADEATEVAMERYESSLGVSMAYDPAYFAPDPQLPDTLRITDYPEAFISFQSNSDMTTSVLADGLAVQSGSDDCTVDTTVIGGMFSDELEVMYVNYAEDVNGTEYQHAFALATRSKDTLIVECFYPTMMASPVGAEFTAMMQTIVVQDAADAEQTVAASDKVQCEICGEWFAPGEEFDNHACISYPDEDNPEAEDKVQCEICGEWFEAGNEFRNHICVSYPEEDNAADAAN